MIPLSMYTVKNYTVSCTRFDVIGSGDQTVLAISMKQNGCYITIDASTTDWIGHSVQVSLNFTHK